MGHAEKLCDLWRAIPDAGIIQISGTAIARAGAMVFAQNFPEIAKWLHQLADGPTSILDPGPVAAILDKWIDYKSVCSSQQEFVIAVLQETDPIVDIVSMPWRGASYFKAAELSSRELRGALLASVALPLVFPSQKVQGKQYAGAGIVEPLPALELYRRGVKWIVSIFLADDTPQNRTDFMGATILQIRPSEIVNTRLYSAFDFSRRSIEHLIDLGYQDAKKVLGEVQELWECMVSLRNQGEANINLADALSKRSNKAESGNPS